MKSERVVKRFVAYLRRAQCWNTRPTSGAPHVAGCVVQRAAAVGFAGARIALLALVGAET